MLSLLNPLKAHIKDGQIVLDEPRELPEGAPVHVYVVSDDSDMSAEERAKLEAAIEEGAEDFERGEFDNAREFALRLAAKG